MELINININETLTTPVILIMTLPEDLGVGVGSFLLQKSPLNNDDVQLFFQCLYFTCNNNSFLEYPE